MSYGIDSHKDSILVLGYTGRDEAKVLTIKMTAYALNRPT